MYMRLVLGFVIIVFYCDFKPGYIAHGYREFELTPQDGWFNNLLHPDWGAIDGQLLRKSPVAYSDGVYHPSGPNRPNPFSISRAAHHGPAGLGSLRNRTAFMVFFGQQVVEEILDAQRPGCPREFFNIPVNHDAPEGFDPENKGNVEMPFFRSRYDQRTGYSPNNPRQQLNEITPFIDGTLMYGVGKAWTDAIREHSDTYRGRLKALDPSVPIASSFPALNDIRLPLANPPPPREHELKPVARFWLLGNPRGNENPFLLTFGVLWFRWHNYVASQIAEQNRSLSDEQVFNIARQRVIAHHQKITLYDWLPNWLHLGEDGSSFKIPPYDMADPNNRYDPNVHPGITAEFQSAAMRYGHTLVTPGTWIRNKNCSFEPLTLNIPGQPTSAHALRLCNSYWNPQEFLAKADDSFDNMLLGLATTLSEREDNIVVPDLREHVFGPLEFSRRDLMALNIQRARDHGLPGYNSIREAYGLERRESWEAINNYTMVGHPDYPDGYYMRDPIRRVKEVYGNTSAPDQLDLFSGGLLETTPNGPGELFRTIVLEQFLRIRHADRFWFENTANGLFTEEELGDIWNTTILGIALKVTNIKPGEINDNPFVFNSTTDTCPQPRQLMADSLDVEGGVNTLENCTSKQTYDYFSGSEYSFALSFLALGLLVPATIGLMICLAKQKQKKSRQLQKQVAEKKTDTDPNTYLAVEWVGKKEGERNIKIKFEEGRKKMHVNDRTKRPLRMIDLRPVDRVHTRLSTDSSETLMSIRVPGEIDLILRFPDMPSRAAFHAALGQFLSALGIREEKHMMKESMILKDATTKEMRKKTLDKFFRVVCIQAFQGSTEELGTMDANMTNSVFQIQLTRTEFADALGLKASSMFVRNMYLMVDTDKDGRVDFREFMEMFMILAKGGADEKAKMLFNMFDLRGRGELTPEDFTKMIKSMLDLSDSTLSSDDLATLVGTMYNKASLQPKQNMTLADFKKIFVSGDYETTLEKATLQLQGGGGQQRKPNRSAGYSFKERRKTFIDMFGAKEEAPEIDNRRKSAVQLPTKSVQAPKKGWERHVHKVTKYVANYSRQIFWLVLFSLVTVGIFLERAFYYSYEREHVGLRRLAGYGVTVTRGAASGMMWAYSCLLLTMSRNTITFLRETFIHRFVPFDSAHSFHKIIAGYALFFTVMHVIGHGFNLYHISTWASSDLNCVFREYFRSTDVLTTFHYWAWTTITGLTGIALTVIVIVMYVFALPYARRHLFNAFWFTHGMYVLLYIFMILHGSGRLVQAPLTQNYLYGPLVVYVVDKLISFSRKKVEISVKKAELLPSGVLGLTFKRPLNFDYKSGQWVRVACLELGQSEYHPFTLTSAPHEEHLSLHIRAVGPWTTNMRETYNINNRDGKPLPMLYLDGPFGEGHQDWYRYKVAVLVGGGIGVTPFASILKDIVFRSKSGIKFPCQKVYFLWVTRTQKQFEWLTDIIREVEDNDIRDLVHIHIFITQFQQKFDLRTTMLYICERHFQKVCGKSLFTGLKATTHFGRPQLEDFLKSLHYEHPSVKQMGVFSCGPPPMTLSVDHACASMNKYEDFPTFNHHFENF